MAADDKESKESDRRRQSRSLQRERGNRHRRHRSASPSPPKQRRKRSRSPDAEEKKKSAQKHEDSRGKHELSNRKTEGTSEEDNGREVARKIGVKDDEKGSARKSSNEDRNVELHSSEDAYADSESDRARKKKKSRSKHHKSRKSKSKHHRDERSESEQDESQTEGTSGESSEDSEDEYRRAKRQKRLKQKEKAKRERRRRKNEKKRKMKKKEREQEKRKKKKMEKQAEGPITDDVGDGLEGDSMRGKSSNDDPVLEPKHKIFLSHSGAQKEFVEHLCKALEARLHYPFFDRRHESLPKGERFPELIVRAAEQCEMLIVVVSDEYFMSKWPMIELNAFVRAHKLHHESKSSTNGPKILPLFYGLSVNDLEDSSRRKKWLRKWETLAKVDSKKRIIVRDWKYALDVLGSFNGVPYDANLKEIIAYEEKIVSYVCKSIVADRKWDDSHVQGKSSIYKVIHEKIEGIGVSRKYKVKVAGIFGVGGVGKTTTCKTMCNELSSKYEGRVSHLEFPSVPKSDSNELFQQVLRDLTTISVEVLQQLNEGECKNIFRNDLPRQKTFVAIDNISDHFESIPQAKMFLEAPYHKDSLVVVTARSLSIFELLGIDRDACFEMPDLGERDAVHLFLQHATSGEQFFEDGEKRDIMTCVRRCYFSKGDGQGHHYHPLALRALGLQLGCLGQNPSDWVKHLPDVKSFNHFSGGNPVFDILRSSFDMLSPKEQTLFMDVGRFSNWYRSFKDSIIDWLCYVYDQKEEELIRQLEHLRRKGLLLDVDSEYGRISMHDLYVEFAELEMEGSFQESKNLKERMWAQIECNDLIELESKPEGGCWYNMIRLSVMGSFEFSRNPGQIVGGVGGMDGMKLDYFSYVQVLQLWDLSFGHGVLKLEGLVRLRILQLFDVSRIGKIEGLQKLVHLTYFEWWSIYLDSSNVTYAHIVGQLPSSLKRLSIAGMDVVLESDLLGNCPNICKLHLRSVKTHSLDLSNCVSLEHVKLVSICKLKTLSGLAFNQPSNLQSLVIVKCKDLVDILGIDHLMGLKKLHIDGFPKHEMPNLLALTKLEVLKILGEQRLVVPAKDCFPRQLQELRWLVSGLCEGLNLPGFNQLELLDLSGNNGLTSLAELGDLPTLESLDLSYCKCLLQLPDLSLLRNLKELNLFGCFALELHEKDTRMLSELPLLQPVPFSGKDRVLSMGYRFRLDCARGKVLMHSGRGWPPFNWISLEAGDWEEQDLDAGGIRFSEWVWSVNGDAK